MSLLDHSMFYVRANVKSNSWTIREIYSNCTPSVFYHVQTPGWWICLPLQVWPIWPGGCSRSVGTHLGSAASTSEHEDRWCQAGLRPQTGRGSRDEQPLIYAAAPDRELGCWELLLRSWPLLVAGSAIGKEEVGWVGQMGIWERVVWLSQGTGSVLRPPGQLQGLCSMCAERVAC